MKTIKSIPVVLMTALLASCGGDDSGPVASDPVTNPTPAPAPSPAPSPTPAPNPAPAPPVSQYMNADNMTVSLGPNSVGQLSSGVSIQNAIDAPTATSGERHTVSNHIFFSGKQLELVFDFKEEFELDTAHFWNYATAEHSDTDNIELTFFNARNELIGSVALEPERGNGRAGEIFAQDFPMGGVQKTRFVHALFTGTNETVDFVNIGFTVLVPQ